MEIIEKNSFLLKHKKNLNKVKILCVGDIILDHYIYGRIDRKSPEAPVSILFQEAEKFTLGGAGNVAANVASLGGKVQLITLDGDDFSSQKIKSFDKKNKNIINSKIKVKKFVVPTKTRFINKTAQLIRVDNENEKFSLTKKQKNKVLNIFRKHISDCDLVVLSDYNKGLLDKSLIKNIIDISKNNNKLIIADPKKINLSAYKNSDIITPNQKELTDASGMKFLNEKNLINFARKTMKKNNIQYILITRSEKGMLLVSPNSITKYKARTSDAIDVTGAGDTVVAVFATMMALGLDIETSVKISNDAASIVVKKIGTSSVSIKDLIFFKNEK